MLARTVGDTFSSFLRFAVRPSRVALYGDTSEDREMLELAHRKYYRWREIDDWREAATQGPLR